MFVSLVLAPVRGCSSARLFALLTFATVGLTIACEDQKSLTAPQRPAADLAQVVAEEVSADQVVAAGTIPLPVNQTFSGSGVAFGITHTGTGIAGSFKINKTTSTANALVGQTNGTGNALRALNTGTGRAGFFETTNATSVSPALQATSNGVGAAIQATNAGTGTAISASITNASSGSSTLYVTNSGAGNSVYGVALGNGNAGNFQANGSGDAGFFVGGNGNAIEAVSGGLSPTVLFRNSGPGNGANIVTTDPLGGYGLSVVSSGSGAGSFHNSNFDGLGVSGVGAGVGVYALGSTGILGETNRVGGWAGIFRNQGAAGNGVQITTPTGTIGLQVVGGTKNAVVGTTSGARALYTEESSEVWFTDYGFGRLQHGRARILIDPTFAQTVSAQEPYHVFLEEYGDARLYVAERTPLGFVVQGHAGDPDVEFSYRIVARRRGYETTRLERTPWADQTTAEVTGAD
jgi:hypothetical protein